MVRLSQIDFVLLGHVVLHTDLLLCVTFLKFEEVSPRILIPVKTINLIRPDVVGGDHGLSWYIQIGRVKDCGDLSFCLIFLELSVYPIEHRSFLDKFGGCIHIQKDTIGEKAGLSQVAWPHLQVVLRNLNSFVLLEVLWQFANLFEILGPEHLADHDVQKLEDLLRHLTLHGS